MSAETKTAKELLDKLIKKPFDVREFVEKQGLKAFSGKKELEKFCKDAIKENPKAASDYNAGRKEAIHFLVGKVMRKTKGKATPQELIKIMEKLL